LKITNQKLARNSRAGNVFESVQDFKTEMSSNDDSAKVEETLLYKVERTEDYLSSSSNLAISSYLIILPIVSYVMKAIL
jgi:hypothetical protein